MSITERQQEFLQSLIYLYQEKETPIHYSEVALKMGVSKWTAYDMLQLLHKEGFLGIEYFIPESGRSIITFFPTKKGSLVSNLPQRKLSARSTELNKLKKEIIQKFEEVKGTFNLKEIFKEALKTKSPLIFCACVLLILILLTKKITQGIAEIKLLSQVIPHGMTDAYIEFALIVFVGMCFGILTKYINNLPKYTSGSNKNLNEYIGYIQTYNQYISQMDKNEQKSLLDFLKDTLDEINMKNKD
ncbi:MAG TPA: hypothetical protein ENO17_00930 [Candidatus Atribacteria bacterium]|nr:hypothetical protein [Candidatus Atribacteria bacterium]